jgi:hypothetical protein
MQPKSVVFPLETAIAEGHICLKIVRVIPIVIGLILAPAVHSQQIAGGVQFRQQLAAAFQHPQTDLLSAGRQQGVLGQQELPGIAFAGNMPLSLKGLGNYHLVFCYPAMGGAFLLGTDYTRFGDYSATQVGAAYGLRFSESLTGGIRLNYYRQQIAGYNGFSAFPVEASIMYALTPKLSTGISFYNLVAVAKKPKLKERLPVFTGIGWRYQFSENFSAGALISKEDNGVVIFNPFLSIQLLQKFYFSPGYESGLSIWVLSAGYFLAPFMTKVNISVHPYLGFSGGLSIQWVNGKKDGE